MTTFNKILTFLPPNLRPRAVIAGGYVASTQANDIDLWVLDVQDYLQTSEDILDHLREQGTAFTVYDAAANGYAHHLVATIPAGYAGLPVQLLVSSAKTPQELVDHFDISTHALAIDAQQKVTFSKTWTAPHEPARVQRWDTPHQTLARLAKLEQRYGVPPNAENVKRLQEAA